jgi:hypothetical protein
MISLPSDLSTGIFKLKTEAEVGDWLSDVSEALGGVSWHPLGGIPNNVHTVEVASDPALALVERPINAIDALLDLRARERGETAPTPHIAARQWWGVPAGGLSEMEQRKRAELAALTRITMFESGDAQRPTITIQDEGTGQHPDDFPTTLLSLLASNKKTSTHQMGVYNAGGAASYRFARSTFVVSRLAPQLLAGRLDEAGVSLVRYNPLDPEKYKSGTYEYLVAKDGSIIRLASPVLPDLKHGSYIKLVEYELSKYARAAQEPKNSLWHLFHSALPSPPLPIQIVETRSDRFPGVQGVERRTVSGLLYLLALSNVADYSDLRNINLGPTMGTVELRYYVLNEGRDPDYYVTNEQGLTITLNGQRQITRDRYWIKRNLELSFIYRRLIVVVDGTGLTNSAKRDIFSSTREVGADTPAARALIDRVLTELAEDEQLFQLDELAKQRVLADATKTTTARVKRQLASQIGAYMKGGFAGVKGGAKGRPKRRKHRHVVPKPPAVDDSLMLEVPDKLSIVTSPLRIHPGSTASLRLEINAKNGFLPRYASGLSVIVGPELIQHVRLRTTGRLLGGRVRLTLEAVSEAPISTADLRVALVVPSLGVLLTAIGRVEVTSGEKEKKDDSHRGGEPDIDVRWVGRDKWGEFDPNWTDDTVGVCTIKRDDPANKETITRVEWVLNEHFQPYDHVVAEKRLGEGALTRFRERYEYPVLFGMFKQRLAEEDKEREADEQGRQYEVPDDYVRGEISRMARAVLMAMEPDITVSEAEDVA